MFYPGDWMKDPELRSVSSGARGLWIDMLSLMHESARRGYLQFNNGKAVTAESLARMTGNSTDDVSRWLQELEYSGVLSRTDDGTIYSRRQVRDEKERSQARERKRKERSCHADVTQHVTPLSVSETVTGIAFDLQGFDFEGFYGKLLHAYPKRRRSALVEQFAMQAVEKICQLHSMRRSEAANYILKRTEMYVERVPVRFQEKFDAFLRDLVFDQEPEAWDAANSNPRQDAIRAEAAVGTRCTGEPEISREELANRYPGYCLKCCRKLENCRCAA